MSPVIRNTPFLRSCQPQVHTVYLYDRDLDHHGGGAKERISAGVSTSLSLVITPIHQNHEESTFTLITYSLLYHLLPPHEERWRE